MTRSSPALARIPMTPDAAAALRRETESLARELEGRGPGGTGSVVAGRTRATDTLVRLRALLEAGSVDDRPDVAVVGRRVTIRDTSDIGGSAGAGTWVPMSFSLVLPGDGEPALGWVSVESPLGCAVVGRRAGERTVVAAPGGAWGAEIVAVE